MAEEVKLLPCPFCGGEGKPAECESGAFYDSPFKPWEIVCQGCGISGPLEDTQAAAITAWNTRIAAEQTLNAELVEALRAARLFFDDGPNAGIVMHGLCAQIDAALTKATIAGKSASPAQPRPHAEEVARLRAFSDWATPGPWVAYSEPDVGLPLSLFAGTIGQPGFQPIEPLSSIDVEFVAAAVNYVRAHLLSQDAGK